MYGWYILFLLSVRNSRYMRINVPYMARSPGQLTVPGGAMVFLLGQEDRDGMVTVIYDGKVRRNTQYMHTNQGCTVKWHVYVLCIYIHWDFFKDKGLVIYIFNADSRGVKFDMCIGNTKLLSKVCPRLRLGTFLDLNCLSLFKRWPV